MPNDEEWSAWNNGVFSREDIEKCLVTEQRYLFLDFDGVINSRKFINDYLDFFKAPTEKTYYITEHIDRRAVERVNKILAMTGAHVVISTAWRKAYNLDGIRAILKAKGFKGVIVGETPVMEKQPRGLEIQAWLDANNVLPEHIVILDDMDKMLHLRHRQVLTDFEEGLQDRHVLQALKLFYGVSNE